MATTTIEQGDANGNKHSVKYNVDEADDETLIPIVAAAGDTTTLEHGDADGIKHAFKYLVDADGETLIPIVDAEGSSPTTTTLEHGDANGRRYKLKYTVDGDALIPRVDGGVGGAPASVRGGHIMARCATGTTQLLAAPPAGYLNVIVTCQIKNAHASSALSFRLTDADGPFFGPAANTLAAAGNTIGTSLRPVWVGDSAVSITVSGTGTPAEVLAEWHQIPKPAGWAIGVVALTASYQNIPNVVPTTDMLRHWSPVLSAAAQAASNNHIYNGDAAAVQLQYRLIRAGVTFDWNAGAGAGATVAAYANTNQVAPLVLLPGDVLQAKVASITVPGAAILRHFVERMVAP